MCVCLCVCVCVHKVSLKINTLLIIFIKIRFLQNRGDIFYHHQVVLS